MANETVYEANDFPYAIISAVTPSNTVDLSFTTRGIYVGGTGDIVLITINGNTVTFKAVPVGTVLRVQATRIEATGTTATNLLAMA